MKIIITLISYVLINFLLWFGQEIYHKNDVIRCEFIKNKLEDIKIEVSKYDEELSIIDNKKKYLDTTILRFSNSDKYNNLVSEYNELVPKFNYIMSIQKNKIDEYNNLLNEYNTLSKVAYSRWWLLPFPVPGNHITNHIN